MTQTETELLSTPKPAGRPARAPWIEQERAVRRYLSDLENRLPGKDARRVTDAIERRIHKVDEMLVSADSITRLQLVQERIELRAEQARLGNGSRAEASKLERDFTRVARAYSERAGISYAAWRQIGVDAGVLERAGITKPVRAARRPIPEASAPPASGSAEPPRERAPASATTREPVAPPAPPAQTRPAAAAPPRPANPPAAAPAARGPSTPSGGTASIAVPQAGSAASRERPGSVSEPPAPSVRPGVPMATPAESQGSPASPEAPSPTEEASPRFSPRWPPPDGGPVVPPATPAEEPSPEETRPEDPPPPPWSVRLRR